MSLERVPIPQPTSTLSIPSKLGPLIALVYSSKENVFADKAKFYKSHLKSYIEAAFNDSETEDTFHIEHLFHSEFVWFILAPGLTTTEEALEKGKVIGHSSFAPLKYEGVDILYHNGCVVDPEYEGNGIFSAVTKLGMEIYGGDYYCCRTQNPAVIRGLQRSFGTDNVFTDILWRDTEKASQPEFQKKLELVRNMGSTVSHYLKMDDRYEKDSMIARSVYAKTLFYSLARKQYDGDVGERVNKYLDRAEGDCLLVFASMNAQAQTADSGMVTKEQ